MFIWRHILIWSSAAWSYLFFCLSFISMWFMSECENKHFYVQNITINTFSRLSFHCVHLTMGAARIHQHSGVFAWQNSFSFISIFSFLPHINATLMSFKSHYSTGSFLVWFPLVSQKKGREAVRVEESQKCNTWNDHWRLIEKKT